MATMRIQPSDIKTYDKNRRCQKCGGRPRDKFVAASDKQPNSVFFADDYNIPTINRTCTNCRFWWVENPLDVAAYKGE